MRNALNIRDPRWCASWRAAIVLILLGAAVYLPGLLDLPTIDRDEARFAQASRQMFESVALPEDRRDPALHDGGLVVPMVQDRPRLNKPPLIYWLQAASAAALTAGDPLRDAVWMYRIPSLLAALGSILIVWRMGASMFDPRAGFLAAAMLALCPLFVWEARQARADHALVLFMTGGMWALWEIWRRTRTRSARPPAPAQLLSLGWPIALWICLALAMLTKGPVAIMVPALAIAAICLLARSASLVRAVRPALGAAIVLGAFLPWLALLAERYGLANYLALAYDETLGRAGAPKEGHAGPPGYHLILLIVMLWPGSMVTGLGVCRAWSRTIRGLRPWKWRAVARVRSRRAELFCLAWAIPSWIVFEFIATKLPHYVMPLLPALALLSARTLLSASAGSCRAASSRLARAVYFLWIGVSGVLLLGVTGASLLLFDGLWAGPFLPSLALMALVLAVQVFLLVRAVASLRRKKFARAQRAILAGAVLLWVSVLGLMIPRAPSLWGTQALMRTLRSIDPAAQRPIITMHQEDSVVFETRGRAIRVGSLREVDSQLALHPGALIVLPQDLYDDIARDRPDLVPLGVSRGFNIARFRPARLVVLERAP